ncbi:MAG: response regulator transcription factor [Bacteroidota bacterium]|nr:response regulator transcription factor [Bacteroidota bacterium]
MEKPKLIIVDDHKIFREGIKSAITIEEIAEVVGEANNGEDFLTLLDEGCEAEIVLMDIAMPKMDGVIATIEGLKKQPNLKFLALTSFGSEEYYYKMIDAGVSGFILKDTGIDELQTAINAVMNGESYFSNELLRRIIANIGKETKNDNSQLLTERESEVLFQICNGLTNKEIAEELNISPDTVKGHRSNILSKTECKNTASLVVYAIKNKLIEL